MPHSGNIRRRVKRSAGAIATRGGGICDACPDGRQSCGRVVSFRGGWALVLCPCGRARRRSALPSSVHARVAAVRVEPVSVGWPRGGLQLRLLLLECLERARCRDLVAGLHRAEAVRDQDVGFLVRQRLNGFHDGRLGAVIQCKAIPPIHAVCGRSFARGASRQPCLWCASGCERRVGSCERIEDRRVAKQCSLQERAEPFPLGFPLHVLLGQG